MFSRDAEKYEPTRSPGEPTAPPPAQRPAAGPRSTATAMAARPNNTPPPAVSAAPDALSLLKALRRRWMLALSVSLLVAVAAAGVLWLVVPTKFIAFSTVQVSGKDPNITKGTFVPNDLNMVMKTHAARFKSRDILLKALQEESVRSLRIVRDHPTTFSVISWLEEELKVDTQDFNEIMQISLTGEVPDEMVVLINSLVRSYLSIVNSREREQRREKVKTVEKIVKGLKEEYKTKNAERAALPEPPETPASMMKQGQFMTALNQALTKRGDLAFEIEKFRAVMLAHQTSKKIPTTDDLPNTALTNLLETDSTIKPKLQAIGSLENRIHQMEMAGMRKDNSWYIHAHNTIAKLREEVDQIRDKLRMELLERFQKQEEDKYKLIQAGFQTEIESRESQLPLLAKRIEELSRETENFGNSSSKSMALNREILLLEKQIDENDKLLKTLQIEEDAEPRATLSQDAVWQVYNARKRWLFILLGPLAGIGATCLGIAWLDFRRRCIHSTEEVAHGLGMRVVGAVPAIKGKDQGRLFAGNGLQDEFTHGLVESIDGIRTLLLRGGGEGTRIVMVTSAVGGEGKTTLASNLALSLARAGKRTVLVDCDLRRPALHHLFEQTLQPGFSEVALAEVELPDAVRPTTADDNLWLLPAGQWDREVIQELAREGVAEMFERLRQEFDFVVVDSHPVLPATDALLISQHTDAVLLSLMRGVSQAPRVYQATQKLADLGVRVFGAVVIAVENEAYGRRYEYTAPVAA